ncbi:DUF1194 domain-containing protein [Tepidamorphus sp. 3E244]|uniref:DUF1194 domain-containing protein n=1 Tax=Tepidamorphus sp. 3E244 TaxID=3385498 RepID=UPI0038FC10AE
MAWLSNLIASLAIAGLVSSPARAEDLPVDLELVLAVDVSRSMTPHEFEIQRRGYAEALVSNEVLTAIAQGGWGRIALTLMEWGGTGLQNTLIGWTLISNREEAQAVANRLMAAPVSSLRYTSISGAIEYAMFQFPGNGYAGLRRVIDVSGDGPNNSGRPVVEARDEAVSDGVIINGLPLMTREGSFLRWDIEDLDVYYKECVIGGTGSFVIPVLDWAEFPDAVRRKLVLEIADLAPRQPPKPLLRPAQGYDCLKGEKTLLELFGDRY